MRPSELLALIQTTMEEPEADIHDMTDNGGYGLVRWSRPRGYIIGGTEHIVHRWATQYTDGSPVQTESGLLLYSGGYWDEEDFARADYVKRNDRPLATQSAGLDYLQQENAR